MYEHICTYTYNRLLLLTNTYSTFHTSCLKMTLIIQSKHIYGSEWFHGSNFWIKLCRLFHHFYFRFPHVHYGGFEWPPLSLDLSPCDFFQWVVSITPWPRFPPGERTPGTHCTGGWVGLRACLDAEAGRKIVFPCRGSNPVCPVRSQTATPAHNEVCFECFNFLTKRNSSMNK
jgi:hypothetical protein